MGEVVEELLLFAGAVALIIFLLRFEKFIDDFAVLLRGDQLEQGAAGGFFRAGQRIDQRLALLAAPCSS